MSILNPSARDLERRKHVKLRVRNDLSITPSKYEGRTFYVVKDPVALRYYRFKEQEHFLLRLMDGRHSLEDARVAYEKQFRPERLTLEDLEGFAQQLLSAGLVQNESPLAGKQLLDRRTKKKRGQIMRTLTNIMYVKIPLYDPEKLLQRMLKYTSFFFTIWFFTLAVAFMMSALLLVGLHFETFINKLPSYHEFFSFKTVVYLWIALGAVKVIHEFGHGLSCKKFGGEVHEMGLLFLVFSPCLYCNVSDSWTLPNKWKRIVISAAGIYVELLIAAISTYVWWYTPTQPFINNLALSMMVVCSVSTILFNANPLMRFDGYYVLADLIEIPNLREKANRYVGSLFTKTCLGIEAPPEPYMARWRRILFITYAIAAYIYRWVITFVILMFLSSFLKPYKLEVVSKMLALAAVASMVGWPLYRLIKNIRRRGRLPDMKRTRVTITCMVLLALLVAFFTVKLPVSRVRASGVVLLQPQAIRAVYVGTGDPDYPTVILKELKVRDGEEVKLDQELAVVELPELSKAIVEAENEYKAYGEQLSQLSGIIVKPEDRRSREDEKRRASNGQRIAEQELVRLKKLYEESKIIRADFEGTVMELPSLEEVGRQWDPSRPLCQIGDYSRLQVVVPVDPSDYYLLEENLNERKDTNTPLPVTIRVQGLGDLEWAGNSPTLDPRDSAEVPFELTNRAGGPIAVKPGTDPNRFIPQSQVYLVRITVKNPSRYIMPGAHAQVKVHCSHETVKWWLWRTINDTFNLSLL